MKVRLGYVALALNLEKTTTSSTLTFARYNKLLNEDEKINNLKRVTLSNFDDLYKILQYNISKGIEFYRMSSRIVPLATHPDVDGWNYLRYFTDDLKRIGRLIEENSLRVDAHPDHFNVINSLREDVVEKTEVELLHQVELFEQMGLDEQNSKMVIHIGSSQGGKDKAIKRFLYNFSKLDERIKKRLILENDDKIFNAEDLLDVCEFLHVPMVFDSHHHICNPCEGDIKSLIPRIVATWDKELLPPKVHLSSPRTDTTNIRKHADFIDLEDFEYLFNLFKGETEQLDIMIEAKKKDQALIQLYEEICKAYHLKRTRKIQILEL